MKSALWIAVCFSAVLFFWMVYSVEWDRPPLEASQAGYRGLAMEQVTNPRTQAIKNRNHQVPEPLDPAEPGGELASAVYENVPVLGDLTQEQFDRLMLAVTEWVSPEQGCAYCHDEENLAADTVYAKKVSARMFQMTANINKDWTDHVGETGVTCYTCHRGNPVPNDIWFTDPTVPSASGAAGNRDGQNAPVEGIGLTSMPYDPFTTFFKDGDAPIRIIPTTALPRDAGASIRETEETYSLMVHLSEALGVNCTYCHNSRSFFAWDQSTPQRTTAWHGIQLVRDLNVNYLEPLTPVFPPERLGPHGDVGKVHCTTCHQGVNKPLLGVPMAEAYPELGAAK